MTGAELRAARKAAKLTQADLAKQASVSRDTVQYWENKTKIGRWGAWREIAEALGLRINWQCNTHAGGWGLSWSDAEQARLDAKAAAKIAAQRARDTERETQAAARRRVICGAKTRKGGECRNKSEPGKSRCKFHGGKSTGPKTPEGRARIAEAQRRRWAVQNAKVSGI